MYCTALVFCYNIVDDNRSNSEGKRQIKSRVMILLRNPKNEAFTFLKIKCHHNHSPYLEIFMCKN